MPFTRLDTLFESKYFAWLWVGIFFIAGTILTFTTNGTCDAGDSVMHYQYARWSWVHPELFFNHWAKPLFVLVASPFAQFGIKGIKLFNVAVTTITILITYTIADQLQLKRKAVVALFMAASPGLLVYSLSGLTEPLFAFALAASVLLYLKDKTVLSIIIVSFMPFIRSEGLIICGVFGLILLLERKWLLIPLLIIGHVCYSIAGYKIYGSLFWVFTKIPYARLSSAYGKGNWWHFFEQLLYITGIPLYALLWLGCLWSVLVLGRYRLQRYKRELVLIHFGFVVFFAAHVLFWALGIFNSFGLVRVFIGVAPLMAIMQLRGVAVLENLIPNQKMQQTITAFIILITTVFPFVQGNHYAFKFKSDFALNVEQVLIEDVAAHIRNNYPDYKNYTYYFDANYVSVALDFDYFDNRISKTTNDIQWMSNADPKRFLIWDDWYSKIENNRSLESVIADSRFKMVKEFTAPGYKGQIRKTVLFVMR